MSEPGHHGEALAPVDREALERCVATLLRDPELGELVREKMHDREPWIEIAKWAAFAVQMSALQLRPWQSPPCYGEDERDPQTKELADRLRRAGLSIYEPHPLEALAQVEKKRPPRTP